MLNTVNRTEETLLWGMLFFEIVQFPALLVVHVTNPVAPSLHSALTTAPTSGR
jgi:hypothetical protein